MGQHSAHYTKVWDSSFKLRRDEEKTLNVKTPSRVTGAPALLAYKVWTDGKPMKYEVEVNDKKIYPAEMPASQAVVSNTSPMGLWEFFPSRYLRGNDTVQFRVESGSGGVRFSDVALWVTRN